MEININAFFTERDNKRLYTAIAMRKIYWLKERFKLWNEKENEVSVCAISVEGVFNFEKEALEKNSFFEVEDENYEEFLKIVFKDIARVLEFLLNKKQHESVVITKVQKILSEINLAHSLDSITGVYTLDQALNKELFEVYSLTTLLWIIKALDLVLDSLLLKYYNIHGYEYIKSLPLFAKKLDIIETTSPKGALWHSIRLTTIEDTSKEIKDTQNDKYIKEILMGDNVTNVHNYYKKYYL